MVSIFSKKHVWVSLNIVIGSRISKDDGRLTSASKTRRALEKKLGARGLRLILEQVVQDALFVVPDLVAGGDSRINAVVVDEAAVAGHGSTLLLKNDMTLARWLALEAEGQERENLDADEVEEVAVAFG